MPDAVDALIPVATLFLGAGLANFLKFTELRRSLRLDAADQLAARPTLLWDKTSPGAWIDLNVALSRLWIRLSLAGIHDDLIERLDKHATAFWQSVHVVGQGDDGEDIWTVGEDAHESWDETSGVVARILGTNSRVKSWWISRKLRRLLKGWDETEAALLASVRAKSTPDTSDPW